MPRPEFEPPKFTRDEVERVVRDGRLAGLASYEDSCVRQVLKHLGLSSAATQIARETEERTGYRACNFEAFQRYVPDFPVRFGCKKLNLVNLALPDLFNRFTKTPVFRAFDELYSECGGYDGEGAVCILFRFEGGGGMKGVKGGRFMTCHNYGNDTDHIGDVRVVFDHDDPAVGEVTFQTLAAFMRNFVGWSPS